MKNSINSFNIIENLESGLRVMLNIFLAFPTKPSKMSLRVYTFPPTSLISSFPFPAYPFPSSHFRQCLSPILSAYPLGLYFQPQLSHFLSPDFPFPPSLPTPHSFPASFPAYPSSPTFTIHCISSKQHNL